MTEQQVDDTNEHYVINVNNPSTIEEITKYEEETRILEAQIIERQEIARKMRKKYEESKMSEQPPNKFCTVEYALAMLKNECWCKTICKCKICSVAQKVAEKCDESLKKNLCINCEMRLVTAH
jgi:hypothetical protein